MSITIPAACLDALGGLAETDAPVIYESENDHHMWCCWHPSTTWPVGPDDRLLLPQSAPALLQVLARHVCGDPCVGGTYILLCEEGGWALVELDWYAQRNRTFPLACPTLTPDMSRMRALAEVVVWLATTGRARR